MFGRLVNITVSTKEQTDRNSVIRQNVACAAVSGGNKRANRGGDPVSDGRDVDHEDWKKDESQRNLRCREYNMKWDYSC